METIIRYLLMPFAILHLRWLQYRYKSITIKRIHWNHSNQVLSKLILLDAKLEYYRSEFHAWGFYHPDCVWSKRDEKFHKWLFPVRDFEEIDIVVWHTYKAVTYYQNKIYKLQNGAGCTWDKDILAQIKEWREEHDKNNEDIA